MRLLEPTADEAASLAALEARLGHLHVRQRLGLERDYEAHVFRRGTHFFHLEDWYSVHALIRAGLWLVGLLGRGRRNALMIEVRENDLPIAGLPEAFDGYTILQLSDLHFDISASFTAALSERVRPLRYDLCVLTGDYRAGPSGPSTRRWPVSDSCSARSRVPPMRYWATTTASAWSPPWRPWATGCC